MSKPRTWGDRFRELHPRPFFLETWQKMDEEAREERDAHRAAGGGYDWRPISVLASGALFLTLMEYLGMPTHWRQLVEWMGEGGSTFFAELPHSRWWSLTHHAWWAGWRVLGFFILPCIVIKLMRERVRDNGLQTKGFSQHAWIYFACYAVVFVCVVCVSYTEEFSTYYPFYRLSNRSWFDFICWELLYAAQFFSLEFFFRGWWLKAGKRAMGSHAIFVMVVPYVMIHFGKPMIETAGAIIAGVVLGTLAMKTRSIWSGFLIHVSVAISMDVAALLQTRGLPTDFWPQ